jgi:hydroxymethylpyrimidine kinase/phosphomethylpyrimidine kinase/thiamine-phosphate diphosphorylase
MLKNSLRPYVLLIAGVDSGGGAGITADCLTVFDTGSWPLPCVSALTAQSLLQVASVEAVDVEIFKKTLDTAISDWDKPSAIKIGVITSQKILTTLLEYLEGPLSGIPVVWDPVLCATAGGMDSADLKADLERILKVSTVFTPNLPEALELTNSKMGADVYAIASNLRAKGATAVIIKGGHNASAEEAVDTLVTPTLQATLTHKKVAGDGVHGGGCALSSSIASFLAQGFAIEDAVALASAYVYRGIKNPALDTNTVRPPCGHNGLDFELDDMPKVCEVGFPKVGGPFAPCPLNLGLYPVVDSPEWIERLLKQGVKTIQLRIKDKSDPKLFEKIQQAVALAQEYKARLFIDDHYELAIAAHAYGVHLGMEDLREADIQKIKAAGLRLGVSTHGAYELLKALQLQPSYVALGHIFPTQSKQMPSKPQGIKKLALEQRLVKDTIPTVAIGGIKLHNVAGVIASGVGSVALITGITKASDPEAECQKWLSVCGCGAEE